MKHLEYLFVPNELALKLKEKGFDEPCFAQWYNQSKLLTEIEPFPKNSKMPYGSTEHSITAPIYQQVIDWLDETHKIRVDLTHADSNGNYKYTIWRWNYDNNIGKWEKVDYINSFYDKNERNKKAIEAALKLI